MSGTENLHALVRRGKGNGANIKAAKKSPVLVRAGGLILHYKAEKRY